MASGLASGWDRVGDRLESVSRALTWKRRVSVRVKARARARVRVRARGYG